MEDHKIAVLIKKASLEFDKLSNQILYPCELTHTQFKLLMHLYKNTQEAPRQIDLEKYFSMTNPTMTGVLRNLERKGLIIRVVHAKDKRSKLIELSDQAVAMKAEMMVAAQSLEQKITHHLTEKEQLELSRLLMRLLGKD